jgi:hypothetical protein
MLRVAALEIRGDLQLLEMLWPHFGLEGSKSFGETIYRMRRLKISWVMMPKPHSNLVRKLEKEHILCQQDW